MARKDEPIPAIRVLMMDDDKDTLSVMAIILGKHGLKVTTAADQDEAIGLVNDRIFDVAVLDVQGAEKDTGPRTALAISEIVEDLPIILMSGGHKPEGPWQFIQKPFEPEDIADLIRRVVLKRSKRSK